MHTTIFLRLVTGGHSPMYPPLATRLWLIGRLDALRPNDRGFESCPYRQVGTLDKSLIRSCLWRFGVKLRHSIRAVSGAPLTGGSIGGQWGRRSPPMELKYFFHSGVYAKA